jgi:hypothetical protein
MAEAMPPVQASEGTRRAWGDLPPQLRPETGDEVDASHRRPRLAEQGDRRDVPDRFARGIKLKVDARRGAEGEDACLRGRHVRSGLPHTIHGRQSPLCERGPRKRCDVGIGVRATGDSPAAFGRLDQEHPGAVAQAWVTGGGRDDACELVVCRRALLHIAEIERS